MEALGDLLVKSAIILNYSAKDAEDVVNTLGKHLFDSGYTKESFAQAALEREKTMPTGLPLSCGFNAAIPHTDIEHVLKPGVAFATLTNPVNFQNMANPEESVQVSLIFMLALDQPKAQIGMLQEIAGILQNPEVIEDLIKTSDREEIIRIIKNQNNSE
ncbi:MAG: PTS sugar transporter subunit IIA [Chloroflexota bacterium]|nr:PTS sugar transporter subunit IIA [Chloroflexota bacterium]